jgi:hypothetical protein
VKKELDTSRIVYWHSLAYGIAFVISRS